MPSKRSILKPLFVAVLAAVLLLGLLTAASVPLIDYFAPGYRQTLATRIGQRIGADVVIGSLDLRWTWHGPQLELEDIGIARHGAGQPAVTAARVGLVFSFADLWHGSYIPEAAVIEAPRLGLRIDAQGAIELVHWPREHAESFDWAPINALRERLDRVRIEAGQISVTAPGLPGERSRIEGLNATLTSQADRLDWRASASGPAWFESLAGHGRLAGRLPTVRSADFVFQADGLQPLALARARQWLGPRLAKRLGGGVLSADIEGQWRDRALRQVSARIESSALTDSQQPEPALPALQAELSLTGTDRGGRYRFEAHDFSGRLDALDEFRLSGRLAIDEPALRLSARHLPTQAVVRLVKLGYPSLADTHIEADVDHLTLAASRGQPLALGFDFTGLQLDGPALSAGPIAGRYRQQDATHQLVFDSASGTLEARHYLRGRLAVAQLDGSVAWRREHGAWAFDLTDLSLTADSASVTTNGTLRLPADGPPVVDINAKLGVPDIPRLFAHLPQAADLPNPRLRDWLAHAINAGRIDAAELHIAGAMDRFPFANPRPGEVFHWQSQLSGLDVAYKNGWPPLKNARGRLEIDGDDLDAVFSRGRLLGIDLASARGRVANILEPALHLTVAVEAGAADHMLALLAQSPLHERFGDLADALDLAGPADLATRMRIPLKAGLGDVQVAGQITPHGVSLRHHGLPGPITDIEGTISFNKQGLKADGLTGDLMGIALNANLRPAANNDQRIVANARLALPRDAAAIAYYLPRPWLDYAQGDTRARIGLTVSRDGGVADLHLTSSLAGIALDLPAPMAKPAELAAPLSLIFDSDAHRVQGRYDDRLDISLYLAAGRPRRLRLRINDPRIQAPTGDGLWIGGNVPLLDAPGWSRVIDHVTDDTRSDRGAAPRSSLYFRGADLTIGKLALDNRFFPASHIWIDPLTRRQGWRINFDGPATQGQVVWDSSDERASISGSLARLALETRPRQQPEPPPADTSPILWSGVSPLRLPRLDIDVARVLIDGIDFGNAAVRATPLPDGWRLDRFTLENGALNGMTAGRWTLDQGLTRAAARTRLEGNGLGRLLRALGYPATVRADRTRIGARLAIAPNRNGLDLRGLSGSVDLALDDGTLLSVEPGAARVVGLLNLYVLPRRLRLDFRDVTKQGLAFDTIRAHFNIRNGNAYAGRDDVRIATPSSKIRIAGRIGLAVRDYDEHVEILPKMGAGLTVASTLVGGPVVGAAMFAVQALFKKPIENFSSVSYKLKGSWANPEIQQPTASDE